MENNDCFSYYSFKIYEECTQSDHPSGNVYVLMLYVPVNIFQLCRDNFLSSWVKPVLSSRKCLAQGHNTVATVNLKLATLQTLSLMLYQMKVPHGFFSEAFYDILVLITCQYRRLDQPSQMRSLARAFSASRFRSKFKLLAPLGTCTCTFVCFDALHPSQQSFSMVGIISCLPGLNQY